MKVVGVTNTKGGTGKTMVSINVSRRLAEMGYKVGLIDLDMDSSNFKEFTKSQGIIEVGSNDEIKLYDWDGIKVFSMSLITDEIRPVSMTGDRYIQMIADVWEKGNWSDRDIVILDLPAGSSDEFKGAVTIFADYYAGNILVAHPSAHDDAIRVIKLHKILELDLIGIIDNMAYVKCPHCGKTFTVFAPPYGEKLAKEYGIKYIGAIPLSREITEGVLSGNPIIETEGKETIIEAAKAITEAKVTKPGFLKIIRFKVDNALLNNLAKVIASFINRANKEIDIQKVKSKYNFNENAKFDFIITDATREIELIRLHIKVTPDKIVVLKHSQPKYEIVMDVRTFARIVVGKKKLTSGEVIDYDYWDAYFSGDITMYGEGHFPKAIRIFRYIMTDQSILEYMRENYGKFLERYI